jgi:hypothetical protein
MNLNKPALLRVIAAFAVVFTFTAGVHELRKGGGGAPDFPAKSAIVKMSQFR